MRREQGRNAMNCLLQQITLAIKMNKYYEKVNCNGSGEELYGSGMCLSPYKIGMSIYLLFTCFRRVCFIKCMIRCVKWVIWGGGHPANASCFRRHNLARQKIYRKIGLKTDTRLNNVVF